jgi:hypothetical protein
MATQLLSLKDNSGPLAADITAVAEQLRGAQYGPASAAFKDIRDILIAGLRTNLDGPFTPLSPVTRAFKAREGMDARTLHASGNTAAGLDGKFGGTWARAQRGSEEWYIFLHDRGKGYSYWTVDGRRKANTTGTRRAKRERNRPGTTQFPERRAFYINESAAAASISRYKTLLETILDGVGK